MTDWCYRATALVRKAELLEVKVDAEAARIAADPASDEPWQCAGMAIFCNRLEIAALYEKALRITINFGE